jgi:hypothetical protein
MWQMSYGLRERICQSLEQEQTLMQMHRGLRCSNPFQGETALKKPIKKGHFNLNLLPLLPLVTPFRESPYREEEK